MESEGSGSESLVAFAFSDPKLAAGILVAISGLILEGLELSGAIHLPKQIGSLTLPFLIIIIIIYQIEYFRKIDVHHTNIQNQFNKAVPMTYIASSMEFFRRAAHIIGSSREIKSARLIPIHGVPNIQQDKQFLHYRKILLDRVERNLLTAKIIINPADEDDFVDIVKNEIHACYVNPCLPRDRILQISVLKDNKVPRNPFIIGHSDRDTLFIEGNTNGGIINDGYEVLHQNLVKSKTDLFNDLWAHSTPLVNEFGIHEDELRRLGLACMPNHSESHTMRYIEQLMRHG